jgi:hypothetical protein
LNLRSSVQKRKLALPRSGAAALRRLLSLVGTALEVPREPARGAASSCTLSLAQPWVLRSRVGGCRALPDSTSVDGACGGRLTGAL